MVLLRVGDLPRGDDEASSLGVEASAGICRRRSTTFVGEHLRKRRTMDELGALSSGLGGTPGVLVEPRAVVANKASKDVIGDKLRATSDASPPAAPST